MEDGRNIRERKGWKHYVNILLSIIFISYEDFRFELSLHIF